MVSRRGIRADAAPGSDRLALLAGCGFRLRGTLEIPATLIPLYIQARARFAGHAGDQGSTLRQHASPWPPTRPRPS